ncbi:MAG TPA: phosphoglycerate dehydrogenase [Syntrophomonadaceae bacterium]|nr:phosphoglycerate dehydrogenase [Syntrophomonadaceae bacterium]HNX28223.1 phosphoglycerate dehydrogenase [Syntrophomonadaceae bacterium]HPR93950.1 phosphoglycerate dehydrogenase [Syntrophomonadaceae bacterium]
MNKVIVSERIAEEGIKLLRTELEVDYRDDISREELLEIIDQYDALIVRSVTKVDEELISKGKNLKVVGRAGNGIDNIDVDVCTRHGVIVVNTPDSNTISAAEQTISLLLSSARNTAWANNFLKSGTWDRKPFRGVELYGKTVGIVGLGRIGSMVATRLKSFNMRVIAYDPYIADERFERYGAEKMDTLAELVQQADFITVHTPRNEETMHMLNEEMFQLAKPGVRVVNCARGGIIKEAALIAGLKAKKIASAALDVFEKEPATDNELFAFNNVVCTPHLGADTFEAQKRVGESIAEQVIKALKGEIVPNIVNLPTMVSEELEYLKPYIVLAEKMGSVYFQIEKSPVNRIELSYAGPITQNDTEILTVSFLKGLLEPVMSEKVNLVNAKLMAEARGIKVFETREDQTNKRYKNLVRAKIFGQNHELDITGCLSRARNPLLVEIDGYETETNLEGYVIMVENEDRPRVIGPFATVLGDAGVNIASMKVARQNKGEKAIMMVNVDNKVEESTLKQLKELDGIVSIPWLLRF